MVCQKCGLAWTYPRPSEVDYALNDFHAAFMPADEMTIDAAKLPWQWRHSLAVQVRLLQSVLVPGAHVHEVGCGQGMMLEMIRNEGYRVTGIEPSKSAARIAQAKGLEVETGYFGSGNLVSRADCVVFSQTLEHIGELQEVLTDAAALVPGGYLLCFQTNYRGLIPRLTREKWAWFPDQHFWHFTPPALSRCVAPYGFKLAAIRYLPLVHSHWKSRLAELAASCLPRAHDAFIALYQQVPCR